MVFLGLDTWQGWVGLALDSHENRDISVIRDKHVTMVPGLSAASLRNFLAYKMASIQIYES